MIITRVCTRCGGNFPLSAFYKSKANKDGYSCVCIECDRARFAAYYAANKDKMAAKSRERKYGVDDKTFKKMLRVQENTCAICCTPFNGHAPNVDHDHSCCSGDTACGSCYRGLLCGNCNRGLGGFKDDIDLLRLAAKYIEFHRQKGRK